VTRATSSSSVRHARATLTSLVVAIVVAVLPGAASAGDTRAAEILADPDRFDMKGVTVSGTLTRLDARVSRRGSPYYTFTIENLTVYSAGVPATSCRDGASVTVKGMFKTVKQVGHHTFRNQIDADAVTCR
jgi:hypothetical protein